MLHNSENTAKHHTNVALLKKFIRKGKTSLKRIFLLYSSSRITSFLSWYFYTTWAFKQRAETSVFQFQFCSWFCGIYSLPAKTSDGIRSFIWTAFKCLKKTTPSGTYCYNFNLFQYICQIQINSYEWYIPSFWFSTIFPSTDREHSQHQETTEQVGNVPQVSLLVTDTPEIAKSCHDNNVPSALSFSCISTQLFLTQIPHTLYFPQPWYLNSFSLLTNMISTSHIFTQML